MLKEIATICCLVLAAAPAAAQPQSTADLGGTYVALGPTGSAIRTDDAWDTAFGGELWVINVDERRAVTAAGASVGAAALTSTDDGRVWLDASIAARLGLVWGASAGATFDLGQFHRPCVGGQVTLWAYVGVMPFVRAAHVEQGPSSIEIGLRIILPAIRL